MKKICLALVVLLIAMAVPAVSGEILVEQIDEDSLISQNYVVLQEGSAGTEYLTYLTVRNVEELRAPFTLIWFCDITTENATLFYNYTSVDIKATGISGSGTFGYYKSPSNNDYVWLTVDEFSTTKVGNKVLTVHLSGTTNTVYYLDGVKLVGTSTYTTTGITYPATFSGVNNGNYGNAGAYTFNTGAQFKQLITITYEDKPTITDKDTIQVNRRIDGHIYESRIIIAGESGTFLDESGFTDTVSVTTAAFERPYTISVYAEVFDKWYNRTLLAGESGPEPDPDPTLLTVYIRNSQTGAAIANSRCVIDALVDGDYYPVVNRTEPSGIFSVTLQPTGGGSPNPDGYRLIASAEGYNNPMPEINFTVDEYTTSIYCYLDPIAGGPLDENNTFIDFFVRDMSANPISGATVKFGDYTLITNSQGYTVFEVDKSNTYMWTVSKSGYGPLTGNAVIGADPRHTINTVLGPAVTPTKPTAIPTSTPISPTPTMTAPSGEPVSNWLEWFAAHFGMILGGGAEIGKIFMWLCFSVPVGVYVGKESKAGAAGFVAGAGIVTLFFVLIGWVPIWLLVLLALIIGLLYAKVFNNSDNGGGR